MGEGPIHRRDGEGLGDEGLIERDHAPRVALTKEECAVLGLQYFNCSECSAFGSARMIQSDK
jgi:hypothetical protein